MTVLDIVVADLLVSKCLVGLCQFDEALVQRLDRLVFGGIRLDLVGVVDKREALVMSGDCFLAGTLETGKRGQYFEHRGLEIEP